MLWAFTMVGDTRIELVTSSVSGKRSSSELITRKSVLQQKAFYRLEKILSRPFKMICGRSVVKLPIGVRRKSHFGTAQFMKREPIGRLQELNRIGMTGALEKGPMTTKRQSGRDRPEAPSAPRLRPFSHRARKVVTSPKIRPRRKTEMPR